MTAFFYYKTIQFVLQIEVILLQTGAILQIEATFITKRSNFYQRRVKYIFIDPLPRWQLREMEESTRFCQPAFLFLFD